MSLQLTPLADASGVILLPDVIIPDAVGYKLHPKIVHKLIYDDSINTSDIHQVLLIDSNTRGFQMYANASTFPIIYDRFCTREQLNEVLSTKFSNISRIAIVSHFSNQPYFCSFLYIF